MAARGSSQVQVSSDGTLLEKFGFRLRPRAGLNAEHPEGTGIRNAEWRIERQGEGETRGRGEPGNRRNGEPEIWGQASTGTRAFLRCQGTPKCGMRNSECGIEGRREVENRGNGERETGGKETRGRASHDADTVAAMTCTLWSAYYYDYPRLSGRLVEDLEHTTGSSPTASKLRPQALRLRSSSD